MINPKAFWRPLALAALLSTAGAAQATITVYTTESSYLAAVTDAGVDTFASFATGATTNAPVSRSAGSYGYSASVIGSALFWGLDLAGDTALSTNSQADRVVIGSFANTLNALGVNLWGTDVNGEFYSGDLTATLTDSTGTESFNLSGLTLGSFVGFVSDGALTSFSVAASAANVNKIFPTLDNLTLALNPVPEPATVGLMLAGLGLVAGAARRRA